MNIVIIEDEQLSAQNLVRILKKLRPQFKINIILNSIQSAVDYFTNTNTTDLIFCDIELIDGSSFKIFSKVEIKTPIIFITAFNNYAKEAFQSNAIGYLTKPFFEEELEKVLIKFDKFQKNEKVVNFVEEKIIDFEQKILIHVKDDILPVLLLDIAFFYIDNTSLYLITFNGEKLELNNSIQYYEQLSPYYFYRINRQYLVNRKAIINIKKGNNRKLKI